MSEQSEPEVSTEKKQVPISPDLFVIPSPSEEGHLVGSKCRDCGRAVFPKQVVCPRCHTETMDEIALSKTGKVTSATIFRHRKSPPGYKGTVPFGMGYVMLPEGISILTQFADADLKEPLRPGTPVELTFDKLGEEELTEEEKGTEVITFKFRPV